MHPVVQSVEKQSFLIFLVSVKSVVLFKKVELHRLAVFNAVERLAM